MPRMSAGASKKRGEAAEGPVALPDLIESGWTEDLSAIRRAGWRVVNHHEEFVESGWISTWSFASVHTTHTGAQEFVEGRGPSDAVAVYRVFCKLKIEPSELKTCPWCGKKLQEYPTGMECNDCCVYYEKRRWWRASCSEHHSHSERCLVVVKPPSR